MTPLNPRTQGVTVGQIGVHCDGQEKHRALECLLPEGRYSEENQCTAENAQQQSAEDSADNGSDAASDGAGKHEPRCHAPADVNTGKNRRVGVAAYSIVFASRPILT